MDKISQIALAMTPGLGPNGCRQLLALFPDRDIFSLSTKELRDVFGSHKAVAEAIAQRTAFARAEAELRFCEQHGIRTLFCTDPDYPQRLNHDETQDCPVLLYVLGSANLNAERSVAVVGTRRATHYGRDITNEVIHQMVPLETTVVSGLAYGIDTAAHKASLEVGLPTVAVLGHGLDHIYPAENRSLAQDIVNQGGALVTEYPSGTTINARYFPARNRIIAALSDATVVVEASERGGALITASLAAGYHREVLAVPGRVSDTYSVGTNNLLATNRAVMMRSASDLAYHMGWPLPTNKARQEQLFVTHTPDEERMLGLLQQYQSLTLEDFVSLSGMPHGRVSGILFELESRDEVLAMPGRRYEMKKHAPGQ